MRNEGAPRAEPIKVGYADRWTWLKAMLAEPKDVLSDATKLVLVAIWEAMDRKTGVTVRTYRTLADALGMKESGVRACATKAQKAGWLLSEGKGGIRYDEQGIPHGIANRFRLAQPAMAIAGILADTCYETTSKVLWNGEQGAMESADTCYGHSDNPPSSPSLPQLNPLKADFKEMAMWPGWPIEAVTINSKECAQLMDGFIEGRIQDAMLKLLGWKSGDSRSHWRPISEALQEIDKDTTSALVSAYRSMTLTTHDLAHVLARAGIFPPAQEAETNAA